MTFCDAINDESRRAVQLEPENLQFLAALLRWQFANKSLAEALGQEEMGQATVGRP
jgi:hypothetical protein